MAQTVADEALAWTNDEEAARLLVREPLALLIGFLLDQQVPMEWAFGAPHLLRQRLGGRLDAGAIATLDPQDLEQAFSTKPPLHRYPRSMARRTQALARVIVDEYGGDATRIWSDGDAATVAKRISKLPGFSANKAKVIVGVLAKRMGNQLSGWEQIAPDWYSLADVDTPEALLRYREIKREAKRSGKWPPG
jgi:uncharacterized HhH-GPD family protein